MWIGYTYMHIPSSGYFFSIFRSQQSRVTDAIQWVLIKWKSLSRVQFFATPHSPWNSPGQNTGMGSLSLLQGIFPTQGSNPGLLHCRQILYQLSHKGSPRILEWVAFPFSRGSSWPRNRTKVYCTAGRFFTNWAIREAQYLRYPDIWLNFILWVYLQRCF